jgi:PIN domain nuclease of toxin-antitoxin system
MLDDVEFQVARLELGPDDVLAVRPTKSISAVMATELRAQLERRLNLPGRVAVLDAGLDLAVTTKTDAKRAAGK